MQAMPPIELIGEVEQLALVAAAAVVEDQEPIGLPLSGAFGVAQVPHGEQPIAGRPPRAPGVATTPRRGRARGAADVATPIATPAAPRAGRSEARPPARSAPLRPRRRARAGRRGRPGRS